MSYSRILIVLLSFLITSRAYSQESFLVNTGGLRYLERSPSLPEEITRSRSAVIISVPHQEGNFSLRGDWKKFAEQGHQSFRKIGIDAIMYMNVDDLNSGPEILVAYQSLFATRKVKNLVYLKKDGALPKESVTLTIIPLNDQGQVVNSQPAWREEAPDLETITLRLGRQVLRQGLERSNFLIPEQPEYLADLLIFSGTRLENFPSRLRSVPLAVVGFRKAPVDNITNAQVLEKIEAYNQEVDQKNQELAKLMELYPFKYEIVTETDDEILRERGFQYSLMPVMSTGKFIKKVLNYKTTRSETDYMASVYDENGTKKLMKIPVEANVCKYYIKQTIVKDIHTGDYWDPGLTWQDGLRNFLLHMRAAFNLPAVE